MINAEQARTMAVEAERAKREQAVQTLNESRASFDDFLATGGIYDLIANSADKGYPHLLLTDEFILSLPGVAVLDGDHVTRALAAKLEPDGYRVMHNNSWTIFWGNTAP